MLINGLLYAVEDLKANTEYTGYTAASPVVQWFWEVVRAFNKEDMARLLQFITGTSKVMSAMLSCHWIFEAQVVNGSDCVTMPAGSSRGFPSTARHFWTTEVSNPQGLWSP